jgi:4-hydroxybenzoate polyprenyltransferase
VAGYKTSLALLPAISLILAAFSPWPAQLATLTCLTLGCAYSVGPRLKAVPVAGSLVNAAGFTPILFLGMASPALPPGFGYIALAFAALLLQNQLIHEASDRVEDESSGIRTSWLTLGPGWTALFAGFAGAAAVAAAAAVLPQLRHAVTVVMGAAFGVTFPALLAARGGIVSYAARLRVLHRWCAVGAGAVLYAAWRFGG